MLFLTALAITASSLIASPVALYGLTRCALGRPAQRGYDLEDEDVLVETRPLLQASEQEDFGSGRPGLAPAAEGHDEGGHSECTPCCVDDDSLTAQIVLHSAPAPAAVEALDLLRRDEAILPTAGADPDLLMNGQFHPRRVYKPSGYRRGTRGRRQAIHRYAYLPEYSEVHDFVWARMMKRTFMIHNPDSINDLEVEAEHRFVRDGFWFDHVDMNGEVTRRRVLPENVHLSILSRIITSACDLSHPEVENIIVQKALRIKRGRENAWNDYAIQTDQDIDGMGFRLKALKRRMQSALGWSVPLPPRQ